MSDGADRPTNETCQDIYQVQLGDTCPSIATNGRITVAALENLNSYLDCSGRLLTPGWTVCRLGIGQTLPRMIYCPPFPLY